jgi:hypothetical protein
MKQFLMIATLFYCTLSFAADSEEWTGTTLSDALIEKVQAASYEYKTCAATELQKPEYVNVDVRKATEVIIKACEPVLSKMRDAYLSEKVPAEIADRQLKKMRIDTTRSILAELMFRDAARKAGQ